MTAAAFRPDSANQHSGLDRVDDERMQCRQPSVEGRESPTVISGQRSQIGVGDSTMTEYASPGDVAIIQIVRPERMAGMPAKLLQHSDGTGGIGDCAEAQQKPKQCALSDRASGESTPMCREPAGRGRVIEVRAVDECDQSVAVQ
jgi:hypothetical protein